MKASPQYGSDSRAASTNATKPWTPLRKSIGCVATKILKSERSGIIRALEPPR